MQLLAYTDALAFREGSSSVYQSSNYDQHVVEDLELWVGELTQTRRAATVERVFDEKRGWRVERKVTDFAALEGETLYAYIPSMHLILLWERAEIPYTRFQTYIRRARRVNQRHDIKLRLEPLQEQVSVRKLLEFFDRVYSVSISLRHSQSPGEEYVDHALETINAEWLDETFKAPKAGALNVRELLDNRDIYPAVLLNHVDVNAKNGDVKAVGDVGGEVMSLRTDDPALRRRVERSPTREGWALAFASMAKVIDRS